MMRAISVLVGVLILLASLIFTARQERRNCEVEHRDRKCRTDEDDEKSHESFRSPLEAGSTADASSVWYSEMYS